MKIYIFLFVFMSVVRNVSAQNVGIGTTEPFNKLHIVGNLLVNTPTVATRTPPTAAQTKSMPGLGTLSFLLNGDSTGRLFDSGGPGGNYGIDHDGKATIAASSNTAIEVTVETMDLNTGDSLIIKESSAGTTLLAVGNGYNSTGKLIFNSSSLYINFKSNVDFNTGTGFSLLFRRLYNNGSSLPDIGGVAGNTLFFDANKGAFRSGNINNSIRGSYSSAMGFNLTASGIYATAMGSLTTADGSFSTAIGRLTTASGENSTALGFGSAATGEKSTAMGYATGARGIAATSMGRLTLASGDYSTAIGKYTDATGYAATAIGDSSLASGLVSFASGFRTTASGDYATALGRQTTASGDYSTAIGSNVSTNGKTGSFILGDNSSATVILSPVANFFMARFAGGYHLITSANLATGCSLGAGDNAWTTGSDVHSKENFAEVNGEDFLRKIAGLYLTSWNYKKQDATTFRHYGPMAQDFYAAFGKDKYGTIGNDTTINSADFAGVSFIAIQALEKRTQKIEQLEKENLVQAARLEDIEKDLRKHQAIIEKLQKQTNELKVLLNTLTQDNK